MKKVSLLISLLVLNVTLFASQRIVLVEEFTNASCPPCAAQNPAFNTLLNANQTKIVELKYQTNWPGVDPMNAQTQNLGVGTRVTYYGVTGVPNGFYDGVAFTGASYVGAPANATQTTIDNEYAVASNFDLALSHSFNAAYDSMFISCDITCTAATSGNLVLQLAIMERDIYFTTAPGTNGETHFEGVMRNMIPNASGTALAGSWSIGQMQHLDFAVAVPWYIYDLNKVGAVAFIQNNTGKAVLQAAYSTPIGGISTANNASVSSVTNLPFLTCTGSYTPSIVIKNLASTALTSATINYSLDGVLLGSQPWTGSLALNATATVALPQMNVGGGAHTFTFTVVNPNGSVDFAPVNNTVSRNVDYPTSVLAPVTEAFAPVSYPPTGWGVEDVNVDGYTWTRSSAGFSGAGSSKIDFFNSPNARQDNLYLPVVNLTWAVSGSTTLEFDVAYAQYTTENDRLKVNVSMNCGSTWINVYDKMGTTLMTSAAQTTAFTPSSASQWRHETVSLESYVGSSSVAFQFNGISNYGNNCYVDNINIVDGTTGIKIPLSFGSIAVYPNPNKGTFMVNTTAQKMQNVTISITNILGEVVKPVDIKNTSSGIYQVDITNQPAGNYFVKIANEEGSITKRVSVTQ